MTRVAEFPGVDGITAKDPVVTEATSIEDRFAYPSTAAMADSETWVMNANFGELAEGINVPCL